MRNRIREYRRIGRDKLGFAVSQLAHGEMPCWVDHLLLHDLWNMLVQWGDIHIIPECHNVHICIARSRDLAAFALDDARHMGGELRLYLLNANEDEFESQFDLILSNGIVVQCEVGLEGNLILETLASIEQKYIYCLFSNAGRRTAVRLRDRLILEESEHDRFVA